MVKDWLQLIYIVLKYNKSDGWRGRQWFLGKPIFFDVCPGDPCWWNMADAVHLSPHTHTALSNTDTFPAICTHTLPSGCCVCYGCQHSWLYGFRSNYSCLSPPPLDPCWLPSWRRSGFFSHYFHIKYHVARVPFTPSWWLVLLNITWNSINSWNIATFQSSECSSAYPGKVPPQLSSMLCTTQRNTQCFGHQGQYIVMCLWK